MTDLFEGDKGPVIESNEREPGANPEGVHILHEANSDTQGFTVTSIEEVDALPVLGAPESQTGMLLSRPLYEIASEYLELTDALIAGGGEMTEDTLALFDQLKGAVADKFERCAIVIKALGVHEDAVKAEVARLKKRTTTAKNASSRLRDYTLAQMDRLQITKNEGLSLSITASDTPASCDDFDPGQSHRNWQGCRLR